MAHSLNFNDSDSHNPFVLSYHDFDMGNNLVPDFQIPMHE